MPPADELGSERTSTDAVATPTAAGDSGERLQREPDPWNDDEDELAWPPKSDNWPPPPAPIPATAIRWVAIIALFTLGLGLLNVWPAAAYGLACGLAVGLANVVLFILRARQAQQRPPKAGARLLQFGVPIRFVFVLAAVWLLRSLWPAVNMGAVLAGILSAWAVFALAMAKRWR